MVRGSSTAGSVRDSGFDFSVFLLLAVRTGILLVLFTPLIVSSGLLFPYVVGKAIFARSMIEVIFALWLILLIFYPEHRPSKSWVVIVLGLWLLVSLIASFAGVSLIRSLWSTYERMQGVIDLAHWVALSLVVSSVFRGFSDWRQLFTVNLAISSLVSLVAILQSFGILENFGALFPNYRVASTLGNPTYLGAYTMISAIIGLGLLLSSFSKPKPDEVAQEKRHVGQEVKNSQHGVRKGMFSNPDYLNLMRLFWIDGVLLSLWAMWLTGSRAAVISIGVGVAVITVLYLFFGKDRWMRIGAYTVLTLMGSIIVLLLVIRSNPSLVPLSGSDGMLDRLTVGELDNSFPNRLVSIRAGLNAYAEKPILGWGPENFLIAWGRHIDASADVWDRFDQAHNKVLEVLTTRGAVGVLVYLSLWVLMGWILLHSMNRRRGSYQLLTVCVSGALVAYFVNNLSLFDTASTMLLLSLMTGFVISEERQIAKWGGWSIESDAGDDDKDDVAVSQSKRPMLVVVLDNVSARLGNGLKRVFSISAVKVFSLLIVVCVVVFLLSLNFRIYLAADSAAGSASVTESWEMEQDRYERSFDQFDWLATYIRIFFIEVARDYVDTLSDEKFTDTLSRVQQAGEDVLSMESENWRVHVALAQFFQATSMRDVDYLEVAKLHVDEAIRLAPNTLWVIDVRDEQDRLESEVGK